jgi:hypothetical protein
MITRLHDWERRLDAYIRETSAQPFAWGAHDCVLWTLGAGRAMTGVDTTEAIRGGYTTARGALKAMRRLFGAPDLEHAAERFRQRWAGEVIPAPQARRGDFLMVSGNKGVIVGARQPALGFVGLDGIYGLFLSPMGICRIPAAGCLRAWKVG